MPTTLPGRPAGKAEVSRVRPRGDDDRSSGPLDGKERDQGAGVRRERAGRQGGAEQEQAHSAQILILVWDASPQPPVLTGASDEAEHGRGLMLVDAVSEQWGWYSREDSDGKFVWAITRLCIPGGNHPAEIVASITQSRQAALPRCPAHGPEAGRPGSRSRERMSPQTW
jgi:hypothetical protein